MREVWSRFRHAVQVAMPSWRPGPRNYRLGIRFGFTLIELLVVIAIVTLLAALLLPVINHARERGRSASCANNLHQLGAAMHLYLQDYDDFYPTAVPPIIYCSWADRIYPYTRSAEVFWCPSFPDGYYRPGCELNGGEESPQFNGSYDLNSPEFIRYLIDTNVGYRGEFTVEPMHQPRVRQPSRVILLLDGSGTSYAVVNPAAFPINSVQDLVAQKVYPQHFEGVNLLFHDGHVKWRNLQSLTNESYWLPYKD